VKSGKVEVFITLKEATLKGIWKRCTKIKETNAEAKRHFLLYFDDCGDQDDFKSNSPKHTINSLAIRGNHDNISQVWSVQQLILCSTVMRTNADGFLTFYVQSDKEIEYIYNQFGFGKKGDFKKLLQGCTAQKYHSFYVNRQGPGIADYYHNFNFLHIAI